MKRTIKVSLSTDSIRAAINEVKNYKRELQSNVQKLVDTLTSYGYDIMVVQTDNIEWSGSFKAGRGYEVKATKDGCKGTIYVRDDSAVFVEFGYGIKGKNTGYQGDPSLMSQIGYSYMDGSLDSSLYEENIGLFLTNLDKGNIIGVDPETGLNIATTEGQMSYSYMYNTGNFLKSQIENVVQSIFGVGYSTSDIDF